MIAEQGAQVESAQDSRCLPRRGVWPLRREGLGDVRMGEGGRDGIAAAKAIVPAASAIG